MTAHVPPVTVADERSRMLPHPVRHDVPMPDLLDRPLYDVAQAARLLSVPPSTIRWWLEGRAPTYDPVLREQPTGDGVMTWGEFVEARYVAAYRRRDVPLQHIRRFIAHLRETTGSQFPLATRRPWVGSGKRLLLAASEDAELEPELWPVYEPVSGQLLLTPPAQSFLDVVEFGNEDDSVVRLLHPRGRTSPVVIDPELRAGLSSVGGISTLVLKELVDAGDAVEAVAEDYGLDLDATIAALEYERTLTLAA